MQIVLIIFIIGLAVGYLAWRFLRTIKRDPSSCCGGCEGCPLSPQEGQENHKARDHESRDDSSSKKN